MYARDAIAVGSARPTARPIFGDVAMVLFLLAQASDGVLTYVGVSAYGLEMEGNPIVAWLMRTLGTEAGLGAAKATAVCFGIALHVHQVHRTVAALAGFYLVVAILPWVVVLFVWG